MPLPPINTPDMSSGQTSGEIPRETFGGTSGGRAILHVDMDAFFAAIAVLDDPSLAGKPVLIGGTGPRSVLSTASYEARKFGCRSAMPTAVALRLCPHAKVVSVSGKRIGEISARLFDILERASPLVQPLSCDEAFVDVTGSVRLLGPPDTIARSLKEQIKGELGLTASVGVASNKFLAKLASDLDKPDGLTRVPTDPQAIAQFLAPLPVSKIWGVGPAAESKLHQHHIRTIGQLQQQPLERLARITGGNDHAQHLYNLARGIDDRPVTTGRQAKSIGHEQTFAKDITDADAVRSVMLGQAEDVARRLRRADKLARGVTVKIRFGDFQTITRSTTLDTPDDLTDTIYTCVIALFDKWARASFQPVRLIGVSASPLTDRAGEQPGLFVDPQKLQQKKIDTTLDAIKDRFGKHAVHRGKR